MDECVRDVTAAARILDAGLEGAYVREDFGQVVVCLESKYLDAGAASQLEVLKHEVEGKYARGSGAGLSFDAISRRVYYLAPSKTIGGKVLDLAVFRDGLKQAGLKITR